MEKKVIFFRVDGGEKIGLGHIVRCMALAQMLASNFRITFICKEIPDNNIAEIKKLGFNLSVISEEDDFFNLLKGNEIVVLDHYGLGTDFQLKVKDRGSKLVCIDDMNDKIFFADLIINHAPNSKSLDYSGQLNTQFAFGLDYVLLRPVFLEAAKIRKPYKEIDTGFICFGGSDSKDITKIVAEILKDDARFKKVIIVVGAAYSHLDELKQLLRSSSKFFIYHSVDAQMICRLIEEADLAIVPSSGILLEVLATGCRIVSGMYVENQKNIFEDYKKLGVFESAGNFFKEDIVKAINKSFEHEDLTKEIFIDGKSGIRLLNVFNQLIREDTISFRAADRSDIDKTYEWATDKAIRAFSFSQHEISFAEHSEWFLRKINSENSFYFIAEINDISIGSIRFEIEKDVAVISYLLDTAWRSQGFGLSILKKGVEELIKKNRSEIKSVVGFVLPQNIPSVKAFERLGYYREADGNNYKFIKKLTV